MNGGRLIRVTSQPLNAPIAVPRTSPMSSARKPGMPSFVAMLAMRIEEKTVIAPAETLRSSAPPQPATRT